MLNATHLLTSRCDVRVHVNLIVIMKYKDVELELLQWRCMNAFNIFKSV